MEALRLEERLLGFNGSAHPDVLQMLLTTLTFFKGRWISLAVRVLRLILEVILAGGLLKSLVMLCVVASTSDKRVEIGQVVGLSPHLKYIYSIHSSIPNLILPSFSSYVVFFGGLNCSSVRIIKAY